MTPKQLLTQGYNMKPSIVQERNAKQDAKIQDILANRKPLANPNFLFPCLVEEKPKKHYYRGKVEPLYRITFMMDAGRKLEKGEKLYKKCCTANCSEPTHFYSVFGRKSEEEEETRINDLDRFFKDSQF